MTTEIIYANTETTEDRQRHYTNALRSVNLINTLLASSDPLDEDQLDSLDRNIRHLQTMKSLFDWFNDFDLTTVDAAITSGNTAYQTAVE